MTNQFNKESNLKNYNYIMPNQNTQNIKEKEILGTNAKGKFKIILVPFKMLSNINKNFQSSNKENFPNSANVQYYFSQNKELGTFNKTESNFNKGNQQQFWNDNEKNNKIKKTNYIKNLLNNNNRYKENLECLDTNNNIEEQAYDCAEKLKIENKIERWKNNFKDYLIVNFLPGILSDHDFNLKSLNNYLRSSLNINITESMPNYLPKNFYAEIDEKFSQFNYYNLSQPQNIAHEINEDNYFPIFYTENDKLDYILQKIQEKISNLKQHQKPVKEKKIENKLNKPFMFLNNDFSKITEDINYNNSHLEDHLTNIKSLILQRICLNKRVAQIFIKVESETHSYLLKYN